MTALTGDNFELDVEGEALATLAEWSNLLTPSGTAWIDALVQRRENAIEAMLREKLNVPEGEDLLQAALQEQFYRDKFHMHNLIVE